MDEPGQILFDAVDVFGPPADDHPPLVVRSPGRVNLIGDHIDYSGGLVLPMALDRGTWAVLLPRAGTRVRGFSANFADDGIRSADLAATGFDPAHGWFNYALGVVHTALGRGLVIPHGFDLYLTGDIPDGGGLSSSASVEMAVATGLEALFDLGLSPVDWAVLGRQVENDYIGVASGIMDQLAIAEGRQGHALLMDCAALTCRPVPMPVDRCTVVIANTRQPRTLAGSAYNERQAAVARAHDLVTDRLGARESLVSVTTAELQDCEAALRDAGVWGEARHTVGEQARVVAAAAALESGDLATVGRLMRESHESLRDDFRVTGPALDALAEAAWATPGVIGARMTGAGFGGCTVNLVEPEQVDAAIAHIAQRYVETTGITPELFAVTPADGARVVAGG
ncbi:MAG: galactokinase [Candidatus Nanopelagicales bacterium]